jgi:hypothetical protein
MALRWDGNFNWRGIPTQGEVFMKYPEAKVLVCQVKGPDGQFVYQKSGKPAIFPDVNTIPFGGFFKGEIIDGDIQAQEMDSGSGEASGSPDSGGSETRGVEAPGSGEGEPLVEPVDPGAGQPG